MGDKILKHDAQGFADWRHAYYRADNIDSTLAQVVRFICEMGICRHIIDSRGFSQKDNKITLHPLPPLPLHPAGWGIKS